MPMPDGGRLTQTHPLRAALEAPHPLRRLILDDLRASLPAGVPVAALLSAGVDSASVLFAARALGHPITAYSFMLRGHPSTDCALARTNCQRWGIPHRILVLPNDLASLSEDVVALARLGAQRKTAFECAWPFLRVFPQLDAAHIISGHCADGHFGISKKAMIHYRHHVELLDEYRRHLFCDPTNDYSQVRLLSRIAALQGKTLHAPYRAPSVVDYFMGRTWDAINRPQQKQPIRTAFASEFSRWTVRPHSNLHMGDTGIADHFQRLLRSPLNAGAHKSVVGVYNDLARKYGPHDA